MDELRAHSKELTAYLEFIFDELKSKGVPVEQLTSRIANERGCQLSIRLEGRTKDFVEVLAKEGVVVDWREPDIIRMAPVPMYNSFQDIYAFGKVMERIYNVS
jgi:kynureninase